ncbi:hypothetical protein KUV26_17045 [Leisingera daeponensis]|uniref:Uncharacterized protein n=1 Tax=Leisingera daeponensis TaxID=405746 RepID=A0ABS7NJQ7_9RHOB|nr:hypothetical protein [Leisingera daeponensis]MBY6141146.1 hypothetical protein [Leisingera daeponensis]
MIRPGLGATYESANEVRKRKGMLLVGYLRCRNEITEPGMPDYRRKQAKSWKSFYRRKHLEARRRDTLAIF